MDMIKNNNKAFVIFLDDEFDFISNFYLMDSYLSLLAVTSETNDKIFNFLKENDPIW